MKSTDLAINIGGPVQGWTEADAAELDALVDALVAAAARHRREGCAGCLPGRSCSRIVAGVHVVLEWRESRIRQSRAAWLRAELDADEWFRKRRTAETKSQQLPGICFGLEEAA